MATRSPPVVNQACETGCTWRMFRIFNFLEGHSNKRLVSNRKHLNIHDATGNGNARSRSDVLGTVDEKYPDIGVSSRRRRGYSCRSISCVENDQVPDRGNEVTKKIVDEKFVNRNYQGKDGGGCQPDQLLDALQILYSNKELFLKLLQDPNSLLAKQIHGLRSSQVKEPYQARQKRMTRITRLNKSQNSNSRQCGKQFKSFDRYDSSCEPESSNRIVVLKPGTINVKTLADTSFGCPRPRSPGRFSYNAKNIKPSHFPFGRIRTKLRHVMRLRKKEQQRRTTDGVPYKFPSSCRGLEDGKKVRELEIAGRNSLTIVHASIEKGLNSSLDLKKKDKIIKVKNSELCIEQEAASFVESCCSNINCTVDPSEENILNIHLEGRKSLSEMLNCGIEECKQCPNSLGRTIPLPDVESLPSLRRYCKHGSLTEGMRFFSDDNYQLVRRIKLGLQKEGENGSLGQKIKDSPGAIVKTPSDKLQPFDTNTSSRKSPPGGNLNARYDIPRDGGYKDSPTQNFDINNTNGGIGSFLDSHPDTQILSFSPEVAPSSPSPCQRIEDTVNMRNKVEHPITESVVEQFTGEDVTNPSINIFQPDESPVQVVHEKFEENHFADLIRSSLGLTNNLTSSKDILDHVRETLQAFSMKWDELVMKCKSSDDQMLDPSTFDELKGLTGQLAGNTMLLDCVLQTFMEVYQNCGFSPHISTRYPNLKAYVIKKVLVKEITELINLHFIPHPSITLEQLVEKDLARRGSWLNILVDKEDIAIEVQEYVLEKLVLEIVSEMGIRSMIHCKNLCLLYSGDDKAVW